MMMSKWGVFSLIFGVFAATPMEASATIVNVASSYSTEIGGLAGSNKSGSISVEETGFGAQATSVAGSASAGFTAALNAGPGNGAVTIPFTKAEMSYSFYVQGAPGASVPVDIQFFGSVEAKSATIGAGLGPKAQASKCIPPTPNIQRRNPRPPLYADTCRQLRANSGHFCARGQTRHTQTPLKRHEVVARARLALAAELEGAGFVRCDDRRISP
jgi:hypothetical protein